MRIGTVAMFGIAFACAGISAFLVRGVIRSQQQVAVVRGAPAEARTIIVAAKDLKPGETLTADNLREMAWAGETLPKGAFTAKDALIKQGETRTLAAFIAENEPIILGKLYDATNSALTGRLKVGMTGVTIRVNDASGVGGFAQPEDRVDILMTQAEREGKAYTATLLRNIRVLAVDQQTQRKAQAVPPKTVTLEVTPADAKKLTLAQAIGQLSLALTRGPSGADDPGVIDINDLLQRQTGQPALTPAVIEIEPIVTITRSTEKKEYKVPGEAQKQNGAGH
jgi:pilus assembly protein CpaB